MKHQLIFLNSQESNIRSYNKETIGYITILL